MRQKTQDIATRPFYWMSNIKRRPASKRGYTCEDAASSKTEQLPLPTEEQSHAHATFAVEIFGRLGVEGSSFPLIYSR